MHATPWMNLGNILHERSQAGQTHIALFHWYEMPRTEKEIRPVVAKGWGKGRRSDGLYGGENVLSLYSGDGCTTL